MCIRDSDSGTLFALAGRPGASVTFDANGGSYVAPSYVALGSPVVRPADPVRAGSVSYTHLDVYKRQTYTWWVRDDAQGAFRQLSEGVAADGTLTLGEALVGKQVKVSANALVEGNSPESGTYTVLAKGEYDLLRATLSPSSGDLFTGDELSASVLAKRLGSTSYGDDVTSDVAVSWSVADAKDGTFVPLASATGTTIVLPPEAAGKFVKATATSGSSVVEAVTSTAVVDAASLEGAAKRRCV